MNNSPLVVRPNRRLRQAVPKSKPFGSFMAQAVGSFFTLLGDAFAMLSSALGFLLWIGLAVAGTLLTLGHLLAILGEKFL